MGRKRTINRKEQMSYEDDDKERDETEEETDEEEEEDDDAEASDDDAGDDDDSGDDDDEAPKKKAKPKKKVAKPKATTAKPKRSRAAKVVRMRAFWGVFNNSNAMVAKFDFNQKAEAEAHAAKLRVDKSATFFVMQQKEPME